VLPVSRLRFVLATGVSEAEVTLDRLALEGTKQIRPDAVGPSGSVATHLPLADKVADEIVCEETEILEKIIPRMFEVMQRVAKFSCDYVKRGRWSPLALDLASADDRSENGG
jgi:hypothetical protein